MSRQFLPLDFITGRIIWAYGFLGHPEFNVFKFIDATAVKVEQREKLESQSRWSVGDFFGCIHLAEKSDDFAAQKSIKRVRQSRLRRVGEPEVVIRLRDDVK